MLGEEVCRQTSTSGSTRTRPRQHCIPNVGTPGFDGPISATTSSHPGLSGRWPVRHVDMWAGSRTRIRVANLLYRPYQGCAGLRGATRTPRACSSSIFVNTNGSMLNGGFHKRARPSPQSSSICAYKYLRRAIGCSPTGRYGKTTASRSYALQRDSTNASVAQTSPGSHWRNNASA
jgi:hypothetical protein